MEAAAATDGRTAAEVGWHVSRYNLMAKVPDNKNVVIANLYKGSCAEYTPIEMFLLSSFDKLAEDHPIIERFARRGVICKLDERAALDALGRASCAGPGGVSLTICPTMGCNFDCPYCFENHRAGKMGEQVQDDVVALAERMLDASGASRLDVNWFGGEPLLACDVIESLSVRLMALAQERGGTYSAGIITNGYLLAQDVVDMLARCKVGSAQITLDGLGAVHDATRHLAGGGPTFERIAANLSGLKIPFKVSVRHNIHEGNRHEVDELKAFVEGLAKESGNDLSYYTATVSGSEVADQRGRQVGLLCGADSVDLSAVQEAESFSSGRGSYCGAHGIWNVGIDALGNLQKCWEAVDKPHLAFGTAHDWDPARPFETSGCADNLTMFLNTACPVPDGECCECVWLPLCVGGCPYKRLFGERRCIPFKDDPERYALALLARLNEQKRSKSAESCG
ncbi:MAG: radical SAM protein [Eggerthellaceae bacterium]|nr:radical SAM protein [Eggerthellaceae bacterium]